KTKRQHREAPIYAAPTGEVCAGSPSASSGLWRPSAQAYSIGWALPRVAQVWPGLARSGQGGPALARAGQDWHKGPGKGRRALGTNATGALVSPISAQANSPSVLRSGGGLIPPSERGRWATIVPALSDRSIVGCARM